MTVPKLYKLTHHQKSQQKQYALEDVAFCPKDFPFLQPGDTIEVYSPEEDAPRLILKVTAKSVRDDFTQKDVISIELSIANVFQLKSFSDVVVNRVEVEDVELDSVELTFKDQYLGRSEMWRLKNSLVDTCVFIGKKIEYCQSTIRCQVCELWSHGDKVSSGYITDNTKIVFRSSTSMVYLFIQMSSEMWNFDIYGDLYFEKAVDGFLAELFAKWKKHGSNHEVTIVLFSRILYAATSLEQFPENMKDCLQQDYKGRFYEDYYRVAVQNERYDDWGSTLILLRKVFVDYQHSILSMHQKTNRDLRLPRARISSAAEGNFLEVLNMSLNVFEKHYLDRSFDRTGQLSVVITPGVGVFEVDRELTNVTMQRIIDNGVGSDLVCVGEQPLHAVPLLKFHNKDSGASGGEDYSMPHWINLSFYTTNKKVGYSSFIPRIKLPVASEDMDGKLQEVWDWNNPAKISIPKTKQISDDSSWPNSVYDFDEYDSKVFRVHAAQNLHRRSLQRRRLRRIEIQPSVFRRQNSEPEMHHTIEGLSARNQSLTSVSVGGERDKLAPTPPLSSASGAIAIPAQERLKFQDSFVSSSFGALNIETKSRLDRPHRERMFSDDLWLASVKTSSPSGNGMNSHGGSPNDKKLAFVRQQKDMRRKNRALINPFDPSHAVIKLTSNRRRWTHIFPRGPTGALIQQHHYHSNPSNLEIVHESAPSTENNSHMRNGLEITHKNRGSMIRQSSDGNLGNKMLTLLWGATGEQGWSPALTTGVDWKSLTIPACLPITTDYFPDERSLQIDYLVSAYNLLPDTFNAEEINHRASCRIPLTSRQVFQEIVSQRLAQGFQLILRSKEDRVDKNISLNSSFMVTSGGQGQDDTEEFLLSIGRIFHRILLSGSTITVTTYRPRHPYPSLKIHYRYRFLAPHNQHNYEASWADFMTEKLEHYKWNYLDNYICAKGTYTDYTLTESLKYWRFRMLLLPTLQAVTKRVQDGTEIINTYVPLSDEEKNVLIDGFLKFIETCINRIRRSNNSAKTVFKNVATGSTPSTGFRERVNSNRLAERPRPRSGSKSAGSTSMRIETPTSGRMSPVESLPENRTNHSQSVETTSTADSPFVGSTSDNTEEIVLMKNNLPLRDIISAMCSQNNGFSFIKSSDLPLWTFVSADAVTWLMSRMEGMTTEEIAMAKFNEMMDEKLICHCSRDERHPFLYGFYLYFVSFNPESKETEPCHSESSPFFQNEWMEVEVITKPEEVDETSESSSPSSRISLHRESLSSNKDIETGKPRKGRLQYHQVYVEVDVGKKSDRPEWGHVRYQTVYRPWEAFELSLQWVQSTGAIITELVQAWSRKAQQCNLQLVPIPNDPYALPYASKSDSLRGPIFVSLNIESLLENRSYLFEGFPEDTWSLHMLKFQEAIILKFGFIPGPGDYSNKNELDENLSVHRHYVHSSGNMFILIPSQASTSLGIRIRSQSLSAVQKAQDSPGTNSYDDYITRHVSNKNKNILSDDGRVGFLWSWNYMVSKRWKTSSTPALGDETFMYKVLRDFQSFCLDEGHKLSAFWQEYTKLLH